MAPPPLVTTQRSSFLSTAIRGSVPALAPASLTVLNLSASACANAGAISSADVSAAATGRSFMRAGTQDLPESCVYASMAGIPPLMLGRHSLFDVTHRTRTLALAALGAAA